MQVPLRRCIDAHLCRSADYALYLIKKVEAPNLKGGRRCSDATRVDTSNDRVKGRSGRRGAEQGGLVDGRLNKRVDVKDQEDVRPVKNILNGDVTPALLWGLTWAAA